jgi:hypothetical protein
LRKKHVQELGEALRRGAFDAEERLASEKMAFVRELEELREQLIVIPQVRTQGLGAHCS